MLIKSIFYSNNLLPSQVLKLGVKLFTEKAGFINTAISIDPHWAYSTQNPLYLTLFRSPFYLTLFQNPFTNRKCEFVFTKKNFDKSFFLLLLCFYKLVGFQVCFYLFTLIWSFLILLFCYWLAAILFYFNFFAWWTSNDFRFLQILIPKMS